MVKSLLIGLVALLVLATGATAAESKKDQTRYVDRLCVWVEQGGTPDTAWDLKAVKAYTATRKTCIVGQRGKPGKNGKNGKAGRAVKGAAGAVGPVGPQGLMGTPGAQGLQGIAGLDGAKGETGAAGAVGATGAEGAVGPVGATGAEGAVGPAGPEGPEGPQGLKGDQGIQGPQGLKGDQGLQGPQGLKGDQGIQGIQGPIGPAGPSGADGGAIITVAGTTKAGEKTFTVDCPANYAAISGGYNIQGSVTASYRSDNKGVAVDLDPATNNNTSWTITQTSGNTESGVAYVYCMAVAPVTP